MSRPQIAGIALSLLLLTACASSETIVTDAPSPANAGAADDQSATVTTRGGDATTVSASELLPTDPKVRIDTLDNGLIYYIRVNDEPENRAELRLAVNAGSTLETDEQLGLAHFLEHMLFNGTCRFPEDQLVSFLERTGMRFGPDINAYTSFDETVYMLQIPTDSLDLMQKAFDVLEDWASCATLSEEEIDKERGVVVEEWRISQQTAQGRMVDELLDVVLHGSRYRDRLPIGKPEIIQNADYETVRAYYRDWYRPELMAVVAIGDFDPDFIESMIIEHFSGLENRPDAPERPTFDVPQDGSTRYAVMSDPEFPNTGVTVYYSKPAEVQENVEDYRNRLVNGLFSSLLNQRYTEIARRPDAPFLAAGVLRGSLARPAEYYGLAANVHEDSILVGLEALIVEAERVRRHGFTQSELERQQRETLRAYERAFNERNNTNSAAYADEYVSNFLEAEPIPGIEYEYELVQRLLPTVTLDQLNDMAEELLRPENRAVFVQMPEKEGLEPPTEEAMAAIFDHVEELEIEPYVDDVSDQPLVENVPTPAAVANDISYDEVGVREVELENGVTVVMKPTDFKSDEVRFTASSPGGASLVDDEAYLNAQLATSIVTQSGVGPFDRNALEKLLAGKVVSVSPFIGDTEEGLSGTAAPGDLETLFQLIHLYFTAPRADESAMAMIQNQYRAYLLNRAADPEAAFQDTLQIALYGRHPRNLIPTMDMVDNLDLATMERIYRERFADAGDFTFVFVGNFDPDELLSLAQTYLGTLPSSEGDEEWRNVYPDLAEGVVERTLYKGLGDKSVVRLVFTGDFEYNKENRHRLRSLDEVLTILLREQLREELGGTYGVSVSANPQHAPDERYTFSIGFTTDPDRVDELLDAVWDVIGKVKQEGPPEDELDKVKEQQRRGRETDLKTNPFWVSVLDFYYEHEDEDLLDVNTYLEMTEELTVEEIQQAAQQYLDEDNVVKVVLYPESYASGGGNGSN